MAKTNFYKVNVYYDDGSKDVREWADEIDLACKDYLRLKKLPTVHRCELVRVSRFGYEVLNVYDINFDFLNDRGAV